MKVLVLGRGGLLGFQLVRTYGWDGVTREECDITQITDLFRAFKKYSPQVVINCAGVVPKSPENQNPMQTLLVNGYGPKLIESVCNKFNIRLIHISTDCVFDGKDGLYKETTIPKPNTFYGLSKLLGEITTPPHLTIRTSFVGLPDPAGRGLLHWAANGQDEIVGYDQAIWNGITTLELGSVINKFIHSDLAGLHHISGETVSKYGLLYMANIVWGWNKKVIPESTITGRFHKEDRTLLSDSPIKVSKSLFQMLVELRDSM
jgi:dTDP-4-dehydrorhamnose reductase